MIEMHSNHEIYEALCVIKNVCNRYDDCAYCPLRGLGDKCGLQAETPQNWELTPPDRYKTFE